MLFALIHARPEAPISGYSFSTTSGNYGPPPLPPLNTVQQQSQQQYNIPQQLPQPQAQTGPRPQYGPPAPPTQAPVVHKHVYVHVPPPDDDDNQTPP